MRMLTLTYALLWLALAAYAIHLARGGRWIGRAATGLAALAWALLTAVLARRGLRAGHWPLTNRYEFALCFTWAILSVYLLLEASWHRRHAGAFALAVALVMATYAVTWPAAMRATAPLLPVLRSVWLQVHVLTAVIAYGAFGVAAGLGLMKLTRNLVFDKNQVYKVPEEEIKWAMERVIALGFPWLTLSILTGAIWAQKAWGRYWGWDPKETWALVSWLWYLMLLHLRPGRRRAVLTVVGFGVVLFTFIGLPSLVRVVRLETLHGF